MTVTYAAISRFLMESFSCMSPSQLHAGICKAALLED